MSLKLTPEQIERINDRDRAGVPEPYDEFAYRLQLQMDRRALLNHIYALEQETIETTTRNGVVSAKRLVPFDRRGANWRTR